MLKSVSIDEVNHTLTIVLDLDTPRPSASGKTLVVSSSRGNARSEATVNGKPVVIGVNAYIKP